MKYEEFKEAVIAALKKDGTYKEETDGDFQTWWESHDGELYTEGGYKQAKKPENEKYIQSIINATCWNIFMS